MSFTPDIKWKTIIETVDDIRGGKTYQTRSYDPTAQRYQFGEVIEYTDFDEFDPSVHNSSSNTFKFKLLEYSNGAYLEGEMYATGTDEHHSPLVVQWYFYDKNGTRFNITGQAFTPISGTTSYLNRSRQIGLTADHLQYGIKAAYITDYFDSALIPVDNITAPYYFYLMVFYPCRTLDDSIPDDLPYGHNMLDTVVTDAFVSYLEDSTQEGLPYISWQFQPIVSRLIFTNNVDTFLDTIQTSAPLKNIPYTTGDGETGKGEKDTSGTGGGDGNYDDDSDPIDFPGLPSNGAMTSGAVVSFAVSNTILHNLFMFLWNTSIFDISTWQKLMEAPIDSIVKLACVPITPTVGNSPEIYLGNIPTGVTAPQITEQYYTIDCGSLQLQRFFGSALDYDPYTKVEIFLPGVGVRQLKTEDVMNTTIHVKYNVDILTGEMVAFIKCGMSVLYHFEGVMIQEIPISARDKDWLRTAVQGAWGAAASGNAAAGISAAINVALTKTNVSRSGSISGNASLLDDFVPYLIIHRPQQSLPQNFRKFKGYPSNITATLSSLSGYTEVEHINLSVPGATDEELVEIERLLKEGVII